MVKGRTGQKSLNLWIDEDVHAEIKRMAQQSNITVKQYIMELHGLYKQMLPEMKSTGQQSPLQLVGSEQPTPVKEPSDLEQRLAQLEQSFKALSRPVSTPVAQPMYQPAPTHTPTRSPRPARFEDQQIRALPSQLQQALIQLKTENPKIKEQSYEDTLLAVLNGNHERVPIEQFRGQVLYNQKRKDCERPLNGLVEVGLLRIDYEDPSRPNKKFYYLR
ncbi:MAG: hypothetical protein INQ03_10550 [Candidatus Heimdallarchaeota archaeon]|nr:hypothetical protein [Candidatus Heimdallarchaeota archaeon]